MVYGIGDIPFEILIAISYFLMLEIQAWDHSKSMYALKGERGYPRKCTKMYEGKGVLKRVYVTHVIFTN